MKTPESDDAFSRYYEVVSLYQKIYHLKQTTSENARDLQFLLVSGHTPRSNASISNSWNLEELHSLLMTSPSHHLRPGTVAATSLTAFKSYGKLQTRKSFGGFVVLYV